ASARPLVREPLAQTSKHPFGLREQALVEPASEICDPLPLDLQQPVEASFPIGRKRDNRRAPVVLIVFALQEANLLEITNRCLQCWASHSDRPRELRNRSWLAPAPTNHFHQP